MGAAIDASSRWAGVWLDALAFAAGLGVAWLADWDTKDLVWSLWLSSLVVGYAMIVTIVFRPGVQAVREQRSEGLLLSLGGLGLLVFFTFHFGLFHFVHSVFLNEFFPLLGKGQGPRVALYGEVIGRYWIFLPAAFLAERAAFRRAPEVAAGGAGVAKIRAGADLMAPYKNVVRMHLLIFFFAGVSFAKFDGFIVYAVVYAVYFFPWRLVRRAQENS